MMYELTLSLRYLKSRRRQTFISLITVISMGGVAVGVMVLIVVLAVMSGFETSLKEKLLGINSHIWVLPQMVGRLEAYQNVISQITTLPQVTLASPFTTNEVMLMTNGRVAGTIVRGVDPTQKSQVANFSQYFHGPNLHSLQPPASNQDPQATPVRNIILGRDLARHLGVSEGDVLTMNAPLGMLTPAGILPNMRRFTVTGTFETGMYEYDSKLALISLQQAQEFFDLENTVHGIEVKVQDIYRVPEVTERIQSLLGPTFWTRDWMQMNRNLFSALRQEKVLMFIILVLIILVAAFNIVSTLAMMVMEKNADIAILKAMGARHFGIYKIFVMEGLIIGLVGTVLGTVAGLVFAANLQAIAGWVEQTLGIIVFHPDVYPVDQLPVQIHAPDMALIMVTSVCISLLATLYPAWNASRLDPVVALRYE